MELLLSSPVPIVAGVFFIFIFIGVFLYELRSQKKQKEAPPAVNIPLTAVQPPVQTAYPPPSHLATEQPLTSVGLKKKSRKKIIIASGITMFLLTAVGATVYLAGTEQRIFNFAQEARPSPTLPIKFPTTIPTTTQVSSPSASPQPTTGSTFRITSATATPIPTNPILNKSSSGSIQTACSQLIAEPSTGNAPLQVTLTGEGYIPDGEITAMQFTFGDGMEKVIERSFGNGAHAKQQVIYIYRQSGVFRASLRVKGPGDVWSDTPPSCVATISVNGPTPIPTSNGLSELPQTGRGGVATPSATPIVQPKTPTASSFQPTVVAIVGGAILVGFSLFALFL